MLQKELVNIMQLLLGSEKARRLSFTIHYWTDTKRKYPLIQVKC